MRDTNEWAASARTVFDCSELTFRSLAEMVQYACGLVEASGIEVAAVRDRPASLESMYQVHAALQLRSQIARYLCTSMLCDFATCDNLLPAQTKVQFISRIISTKLDIVRSRITRDSLAGYKGSRKHLKTSCEASFLDEETGEISQFERLPDGFYNVTTADRSGFKLSHVRTMDILDPKSFDKGSM